MDSLKITAQRQNSKAQGHKSECLLAGDANFEHQKAEDQGHNYSFSKNSIYKCLIKQDSELVITIIFMIILL